jgi:hypothetical protein
MRDLVFKEGKIRPFTEFRAEALKIHQKYNQDWLLTEYNAVVRGSVMGKKWLNIERDKDIYATKPPKIAECEMLTPNCKGLFCP